MADDVAKCLVKLSSATQLKAADFNGLSDPYCVLRIGSSTYRSKCCPESLNPVWKEECLLSVSAHDRYLVMSVFDRDRTSLDEKLGEVMVSLFAIPVHEDHDTPLSLAFDIPLRGDNEKNKNPPGRLQFSVHIRWVDPSLFFSHQAAAWRLQGWSSHPTLAPSLPQYNLVGVDSRHVFPECVELYLSGVTVRNPHRYCLGSLFLTYCRLVFVSDVLKRILEPGEAEESVCNFARPAHSISNDLSFCLPLGLVLTVELVDPCTVRIETLDMNVIQISFPTEDIPLIESFVMRLESIINNRGDTIIAQDIYAGANALVARVASASSKSEPSSSPPAAPLLETTLRYDLFAEVRRQGLHLSSSPTSADLSGVEPQLVAARGWRCSTQNIDFSLCETYPQFLIVPEAIPDAMLKSVGSYRSKGRIPALSYFHSRRGTAISRCAQPLAGWIGKTNEADQKLIQAIRQVSPGAKLTIIDARSPLAASGNSIKGAGTENIGDFPGCQMQFMYIGNIHDMRNSFNAVRESIQGEDAEFHHDVAMSKWFKHLGGVIHGAVVMARLMEEPQKEKSCACGTEFKAEEKSCAKCKEPRPEGTATSCLVHCSDGWDRTAQLCSLTQLLLDPHTRTFEGFRLLVQKDWLSFGHKFHDRLGRVCLPEEQSPIFLQWLDCVHQVCKQFPTAFEFTPDYLAALARFAYSGWCGEFLRNSERERVADKQSMISVWTLLKPYQRRSNPQYAPMDAVLLPVSAQKGLVLWSEFYLRYAIPPDDRDTEPEAKQEVLKTVLSRVKSPTLPVLSIAPPIIREGIRGAISGLTSALAKNDNAASCAICGRGFSIWRGRRKCPACAGCVCSSCSSQKVPASILGQDGGGTLSVCDPCYSAYASGALRGTRPQFEKLGGSRSSLKEAQK